MWLVLLCVVAAVVGFYLFQSKQKNKASLKRGRNGSARPRQESKANQYRAISICCEEHACAAAVAVAMSTMMIGVTMREIDD